MFNRAAYENSRPGGIGVLEVLNGADKGKDQPRLFVPLKRTELRGEIAGPLASLFLTQIYSYSREELDKVLEAVYRFPLPGDAAVTGVKVTFGEVEITAELKERKKAEQEYEKAKEEGRQAALATRESPNVFTLRVTGLQPDEDVKVETSYVQLAQAQGEGWSLRVPLTTAPRYVRSDEATSRPAEGQPLLLLRDPGHRFSLDLSIVGAEGVASPTHELKLSEAGETTRVNLSDGEVVPDRDCVLSWLPRRAEDRPALRVMVHEDSPSGMVYFLALVAPPAGQDLEPGVPREVILLVDHSGSMSGPKWEAADWAVEQFLLDLDPGDNLALCLFHNTARWFSEQPQGASSEIVDQAIKFLLEHKDSGGTELGVALEQALHLKRSTDERARHVVIVTDAQVSDAGRILRLADEEAERDHRRRISVLCIDAAPNSFLASELAQRGGGLARFLTSSPDELDITTALDEVLKDWAQPVLADLRLEVDRGHVESASREVLGGGDEARSLIDLGDLPRGRALWVAGRVPRADRDTLQFRVATAAGDEVAAHSVGLGEETNERAGLKALFGARRVLGLEYLINSVYSIDELREQLEHLQYDADEILGMEVVPSKVYAENVREDAEKALRSLLVREALEYGLASAETAFVAVRMEAGQPVEGTVPVASALPLGWSERFLTPMGKGLRTRMGKGLRSPGAGRFFRAASPITPDLPASLMARAVKSSADAGTGQLLASIGPGATEPSRTLEPVVLYSGVPQFEGDEAILYDSSREKDADKLSGLVTLRGLEVRFPEGTVDRERLDARLRLLIFVGDLASPRAMVRLVDLVRRRGKRPLNISRADEDVIRIVLVDPQGAWSRGAPSIEVALV
jgi:Ca-activated chloride channel family protein